MVWYTGQSLLLILLAFLLGLLVGYLWWGLRLRRARSSESRTESAPVTSSSSAPAALAAEPATSAPVVSEPVAAEPVVAEPVVSEPVVSEPEVSEPVAAEAEPEPASLVDSELAAEPVVVSEPAADEVGVAVAEVPDEERTPATVDADAELVADVESAFAAESVEPEPVVAVAHEPVAQEPAAQDALERIEGIGPKIAAALRAAGITTFAQLADADRSTVEVALESANLRFAPSLGTWSKQARLLADGDEAGFKELTDRLVAGREASARTKAGPAFAEPMVIPPVAAEESIVDEPVTLTDAAPVVDAEPVALVEAEPVVVPEAEPVAVVEDAPVVEEPVAEEPVVEEPVHEPVAEPVVVPAQAAAAEDLPVDNLKRIEGIGPKMSGALVAAGIRTFGQLAEADEATLRDAIETAGLRFAPSLVTWARQARLLADGDEEGFADLTRRLVAGRDTGRA